MYYKVLTLESLRDKLIFFTILLYVLSQAYTIPVVAAGPSWATWPTLSDFTAALMVLGMAVGLGGAAGMSPMARRIFLSLTFMAVVANFSILVLLLRHANSTERSYAKSLSFAVFQMLKFFEFIAIYVVVSKSNLTEARLRAIVRAARVAFWVVCLFIVLTHFKWVTTSDLSSHLPAGRESGPWEPYILSRGEEQGLGTIGYNHAYVSAQVIALMTLQFTGRRSMGHPYNYASAVCALICVFFSGSRSGLLSALACTSIVFARNKLSSNLFLMGSLVLLAISSLLVVDQSRLTDLVGGEIASRQATSFQFYEAENLSGRDDIWDYRLEYFNDNILDLFLGLGFGSSIDHGGNAHNQVLQVLFELGVIGCVAFLFLIGGFTKLLLTRRIDSDRLLCLHLFVIVSSLTQETLYPVPAFGQFMGLYLFVIALTLKGL